MTHQTLDYANRIRERGFRLTPQRELVLEAVSYGNGHTSYESFRTGGSQRDSNHRSSVFRTLHLHLNSYAAG